MKYKSLLFPVRAWHLRALLNLALSVAVASEVRAQFVINELMQSDIGSVVDDLNEFPDSWVELYNTSDRAAVFKDYSIGLSSDPSQAWPLPPRYVPAHGRFLIYCDKEATGWHTDFRLESTKKGTVYLFKAAGPTYPPSFAQVFPTVVPRTVTVASAASSWSLRLCAPTADRRPRASCQPPFSVSAAAS